MYTFPMCEWLQYIRYNVHIMYTYVYHVYVYVIELINWVQ